MPTWDDATAWPTMVVEHGANPGWVSHATRAALGGYVQRYADRLPPGDAAAVREAWDARRYAQVAQRMGVRVIQIAERGGVAYSPTVCYAYWPCDAAVASIHALRGELRPAAAAAHLSRDIVSGADYPAIDVAVYPCAIRSTSSWRSARCWRPWCTSPGGCGSRTSGREDRPTVVVL